jgi:hypothetical protein
MVGYANDHCHDTYWMFDSSTREVILSRDDNWVEWKCSDPASSLPLILHKGTPFATGEDNQDPHQMDQAPISPTGTPPVEEIANCDALMTDSEKSGSGRMGALAEETEDEDDYIALWGLSPGMFNKAPPRLLGQLNQSRDSSVSGHSRG